MFCRFLYSRQFLSRESGLDREPVEGADVNCLRMFKPTFKPNGMRVMSLIVINKELGNVTVSFPLHLSYLVLRYL